MDSKERRERNQPSPDRRRRKIVGTNVRRRRRELGIGLEHFAELANCEIAYVIALERGYMPIRQAKLRKFAQILCTTPARLQVLVP